MRLPAAFAASQSRACGVRPAGSPAKYATTQSAVQRGGNLARGRADPARVDVGVTIGEILGEEHEA